MKGTPCPTCSTRLPMWRRCSPASARRLSKTSSRRSRRASPQTALAIPPGMDEITLSGHMAALANKNQSASDAVCFLGGGAYDHFIPSAVDAIAGRSENYTAYTPYQAEASQGTLQCVFEYQTLMCQLTGLDVANASLYEGGSAVAEAVLMALGVTGRSGDVLIAESVHPEYRQTLITYLANLNCKVRTLPTPSGVLDPDDMARAVNENTIAVIAQSPNFFGHLEEMEAIGIAAKKSGALFIASFDPVGVGPAQAARRLWRGHRRGGGPGPRCAARLRRPLPRHPRLPQGILPQDPRPARRSDHRPQRQTLLGCSRSRPANSTSPATGPPATSARTRD